jgi:hypothetical protein
VPVDLRQRPPEDDEVLLDWLQQKGERHKEQIDAAWRVVLGDAVYDAIGS